MKTKKVLSNMRRLNWGLLGALVFCLVIWRVVCRVLWWLFIGT